MDESIEAGVKDDDFVHKLYAWSDDKWEANLNAFLFVDNGFVEDVIDEEWELDLDALLFDDDEHVKDGIDIIDIYEDENLEGQCRIDLFQYLSYRYYIFTEAMEEYMINCFKKGPTFANPCTICKLDKSFFGQENGSPMVSHKKVLHWTKLEDRLVVLPILVELNNNTVKARLYEALPFCM